MFLEFVVQGFSRNGFFVTECTSPFAFPPAAVGSVLEMTAPLVQRVKGVFLSSYDSDFPEPAAILGGQ